VNTQGIINRFAGVSGGSGSSGDGGPATSALFGGLYGVAVDSARRSISRTGNYRFAGERGGIITTACRWRRILWGDRGWRPATSAFLQPSDVAVDSAGNYYIADYVNNRVRKSDHWRQSSGLLSAASSLYFSIGVAVNSSPNPETIDAYTLGAVPLLFTVSSVGHFGRELAHHDPNLWNHARTDHCFHPDDPWRRDFPGKHRTYSERAGPSPSTIPVTLFVQPQRHPSP